jgi:probable F420-dependent oxidoreductase
MTAGAPARRWGVGLHYGGTDRSMPIVELAQQAEARGFDGMFVPEHTHIPSSRATPYPGGGEIPERYLRLWDPLVALSFVAAQTSMVVGSCVCLPGEHDPIALAKAVATIDVQSGGRFVLGVGFGWNNEEFADHGFAIENKHSVVTEKIELMKRLWTEDEAGFEGEFVRLSPSWAWPKPLQRPHPPVLVGGGSNAATFRRVVAWGDGWIPMSTEPSTTLADDLTRLRNLWAEAGRDPAGPHVVVMQRPLPTEDLRAVIGRYRELGVHRVLLDVPTEGADVVLPVLDAAAPAVAEHQEHAP